MLVSASRRPTSRSTRAAFSLVELLVVIAIIAIIVAIIVPSLGGVRRAGRVAATRTLLNEVNTAAAKFQTDERRLPGYFTPTQMGTPDNDGRGFSAMNNILLDLSGGIVRAGTGPTSVGSGQARVGPTRLVNEQVIVDPNLIGSSSAGSKGYFIPGAKNFVKLTEGQKDCSKATEHYKLPDLVDSFGNPVMAWAENEAAASSVSSIDDFAQKDSGTPSKPPARFYWNSNASLLNATAMGKTGKDQSKWSMLCVPGGDTGGSLSPADRAKALAGLLGNPGFPQLSGSVDANILPAAARGRLILQSAGIDGVFLSRYDSGAKLIGGQRRLTYGHYFSASGNPQTNPYKDGDRTAPQDYIAKFDDILGVGGS